MQSGQTDRKILPLKLAHTPRPGSKIIPTFFVLTNLGRFDFGMSQFQTISGRQTMTEVPQNFKILVSQNQKCSFGKL